MPPTSSSWFYVACRFITLLVCLAVENRQMFLDFTILQTVDVVNRKNQDEFTKFTVPSSRTLGVVDGATS